MSTSAFKRGFDRDQRRRQLKVQGAFTAQHLRLKEQLLEGALTARRTAKGPTDDHVESLMLDWSLIREALERGAK